MSESGTDHEGDPVVAKITGELKARYPDWRLTTHYTPEGRKVTMIEFADGDGEFTEGLSSEFVSMVSQAYGRSQDTEVSAMSESGTERIERKYFADKCTCGGQYIGGMCTKCRNVGVRDE